MVSLHRLKTMFCEWVAIFRKRDLYKDITWTADQQQAFDKFWTENYGRKISPRWHKLYQSINGVFNIEYIPEIMYSTKIEPYTNDLLYSKILQNKSLIEILVRGNTFFNDNKIRVPLTYVVSANGWLYDGNRNVISMTKAQNILGNIGYAVIKPIVGGSSGENVRILHLHEGSDTKSEESLSHILKSYGLNYIVQEKINQCDYLDCIYPEAVNTIRIITYILNDHIIHFPLTLRMGAAGGEVDNIHAGGIAVGIMEDGRLMRSAYCFNCCGQNASFEKHPDTGIIFDGWSIKHISSITHAAYMLHGQLPGIGVISWDFAIDTDYQPVLIEANLIGQSIWFPQIVSGKGVFGKDSALIIRKIRGNC